MQKLEENESESLGILAEPKAQSNRQADKIKPRYSRYENNTAEWLKE